MRSLAPVYELPGVQRVSLAQLIAAPREVFRELRPDTSLRPFLYVLMIAVPVLPVLMAIVSTDALREGFLSSSETASIAQHAPVVAFAFSIAMLCAQGVELAAHLLVWAAVCFYIAARSTLHLGKVRAVVVALFCSFIGAVSPLLEHVIRSL